MSTQIDQTKPVENLIAAKPYLSLRDGCWGYLPELTTKSLHGFLCTWHRKPVRGFHTREEALSHFEAAYLPQIVDLPREPLFVRKK